MANFPRERLFQEPPFTHCDIVWSHLGEERLQRNEKIWVFFSHVFQVEQFILNQQIHYPLMPSYKHFNDLYQEEVLFESSELTMAQILLGPVKKLTRHFQRCTTRKSMSSCWSMVVNGSSGKGILPLLTIWKECGSTK